MTTNEKIETVIESGAEIFVPLNKLKKSPRNARKTPHSEAHVEALAASIAVKGMLQNLVVEPEQDADGGPMSLAWVHESPSVEGSALPKSVESGKLSLNKVGIGRMSD
jgi:hypothetical protein